MRKRRLALERRDDLSGYTREELVTHFVTLPFFPLFFGFAFAMDRGEGPVGWESRRATGHMHLRPVPTPLDQKITCSMRSMLPAGHHGTRHATVLAGSVLAERIG